jgi:hypothetical protein
VGLNVGEDPTRTRPERRRAPERRAPEPRETLDEGRSDVWDDDALTFLDWVEEDPWSTDGDGTASSIDR